MNIKPLKIGELEIQIPIIQGGMGIGVSSSNLASAVANEGGIGVVSAANIGYKEKDFETNTLEANLRALKKHIKISKKNAPNGIIGVNVMVAMKHYDKFIKASIESGADIIISGAGMPTNLPKLIGDSKIKIAPIISSAKGTKVLLKLWDRHYNKPADMVIVEGPKAGGHLGFKKENIEEAIKDFDKEILNIIKEVKVYEEKYNRKIPLIVAGGVFNGEDIVKYIKLGADGVQMATRFVATEECDASKEFKEAYVKAKEEDIVIVKSPVGMPGRAILNPFVKKTFQGNEKITKCFKCLEPCNPKDTPYCITKALLNAVKGNINEGLVFCGSNAYRIDKIITVKELINELRKEIELAL